MNKKILVISGIVLMMLFTTITIPVVAEPNDAGILGRTHIRAIGSFSISEENGNLIGHVFIGFIDFQPVFNLDIEICKDSIKRNVMVGFSVGSGTGNFFYLNCVFKE